MWTCSILGVERDAHTPRHHHLDKIFSFSFLVATIFLYPVAVVSRTNPKICHLSIRFEPATNKSESILISNTPHKQYDDDYLITHTAVYLINTTILPFTLANLQCAQGSSHKRSWSDASNDCREEVSTLVQDAKTGSHQRRKSRVMHQAARILRGKTPSRWKQ